MKHSLLKLFSVLFALFLMNSCVQQGDIGPQGPQGPAGADGADGTQIYYSQWYTPLSWSGQAGDWYFDISNSAITQDVVEAGVILAYMSVPNDLYASAVRPMPAFAIGANWDFLIPDYGQIEFTCDSQEVPGITDYYFRFILIPPGTQIPSSKKSTIDVNALATMEYSDVCKLLGIPE